MLPGGNARQEEKIISPRSKKEYLEAIAKRYKKATKVQKHLILDEFCAATEYHRKQAIRKLSNIHWHWVGPGPTPLNIKINVPF